MNLIVEVYKYQDKPHLTYPVRLLSEGPTEFVLLGEWGRVVKHYTRGRDFIIENQSIEFLWADRPYTVAVDCGADGSIRSYYCNINLPVEREGDRIRYIDLDLDLQLKPDLSCEILDEDEFLEHQVRYGYPPEVCQLARQALQDLIAVVDSRSYPFDGTIERLVRERFRAA